MALSVKHLDARSLRALAHPLRVRLVGALRADGPATATMLAERLGESSGATSYHLRVLAEHGFVVEDTARNRGRERWWMAGHDMTSWRSGDFADDADARAADEWLMGFAARRGMEELDEWMRQRPDAPPAWVAASEASDYLARMTPVELRALLDEVNEVILRHVERVRSDVDDAEADDGDIDLRESGGRALVRVLLYAFPRDPDASPV
jgi:DNA-binding transcriptional ArsR family regulator